MSLTRKILPGNTEEFPEDKRKAFRERGDCKTAQQTQNRGRKRV